MGVWLDTIFRMGASYNPITRGQHFQGAVVPFLIMQPPAPSGRPAVDQPMPGGPVGVQVARSADEAAARHPASSPDGV